MPFKPLDSSENIWHGHEKYEQHVNSELDERGIKVGELLYRSPWSELRHTLVSGHQIVVVPLHHDFFGVWHKSRKSVGKHHDFAHHLVVYLVEHANNFGVEVRR